MTSWRAGSTIIYEVLAALRLNLSSGLLHADTIQKLLLNHLAPSPYLGGLDKRRAIQCSAGVGNARRK
ncbi:hypothetical protein GCM10007159_07670 [Modicisalibacter luteus]|nr:hypothetical protein GCM10007159_07670 [Halomonas lutea]